MNFESLSILVVEDDYSFSLELKMLINELGYSVAACIDNSEEAIRFILQTPPDLILMDIDIMGDKNGITVAKEIKHLNIPVLFITSYRDKLHYEQAQKTNLIGFLVKPIEDFTLKTAINFAIQNLAHYASVNIQVNKIFPFKDQLFFKYKGVFKKINIPTISYIEADGNYCTIYWNNKKIVTSIRLNELESMLEDYGFFRIHRKYIINLTMVTSFNYSNNTLNMQELELPISRSKKGILKKQMNMLQ